MPLSSPCAVTLLSNARLQALKPSAHLQLLTPWPPALAAELDPAHRLHDLLNGQMPLATPEVCAEELVPVPRSPMSWVVGACQIHFPTHCWAVQRWGPPWANLSNRGRSQ